MKLKTVILLACLCALPVMSHAQQNYAYGNITASGSACTTANACISLNFPIDNTGSATVQLTGTFSGTFQFEGTNDFGSTWVAVAGVPFANGSSVTSSTTTGNWQFNVGGMTGLRVRCSAYTSGTAAVVIKSAAISAKLFSGTLALTQTPLTTRGDILTVNSTPALSRLAIGANLTFFSSNGTDPSWRTLNQTDIPTAAIASVDNSIISSAVDASGNPNHIVTAVSTAALPINGGTTSLSLYIAGKCMTLNTNVTTTLTTGVNYIYALGDTTTLTSGCYVLTAPDFIASLIPLSYSYVAPSCSNGANTANGVGGFAPAASASVPHYWFNMATNQMNICTSSGGSFTATSYGGANAPAIEIGVAYYDGTSIQSVGPMPFGGSPIRIVQNFGTGSDGAMLITSAGTTTKDGIFNFSSLAVITGTLTHTSLVSNQIAPGLFAYSQNPVIVWNGTIGGAGLGRGVGAQGTGAGGTGNAGGMGGNGGGGGGSGATAANGGVGGGRLDPMLTNVTNTGGTAGAGAGGNGPNSLSIANALYFLNYQFGCSGASGGSGAGDGTNNGGQGGAGGGYVVVRAPSVSITGTGIIKADGAVGGTSAGGNGGGGGGGGGGCAFVAAFASYTVTSGTTLTAAGGAVGTKTGTGNNGGSGGTGLAVNIRLQ